MKGRKPIPPEVRILQGKRSHSRIPTDRAVSNEPIGDPPAHLTPELKAIFRELVCKSPSGAIKQPDVFLVELAARLILRSREPDASAAILARLQSVLASLGMTPVDRSRIIVGPQETDGLDEIEALALEAAGGRNAAFPN